MMLRSFVLEELEEQSNSQPPTQSAVQATATPTPVVHPAPTQSSIYETPKIETPTVLPPHYQAMPLPMNQGVPNLVSQTVPQSASQQETPQSHFDTLPDKSAEALAQLFDSPVPEKTTSPWISFFKQGSVYAGLFMLPIVVSVGVLAFRSGSISLPGSKLASADLLSPIAQTQQEQTPVGSSNTLTQTQLSSANAATSYEYELSLAQGFLQKAVSLSNATQTQTTLEKQQIVEFLNQALLASNRAISMKPDDHKAFTIRGRVYMATSVMTPGNKQLADADFAKAQQLGATSTGTVAGTGDPIDQLPTEQASTTPTALVASPEEKTATTETTVSTNAITGTATIYEGLDAVFVENTSITGTSTITTTINGESNGLQPYIKNKRDGLGFTIGLTSPTSSDVQIEWTLTQE